jgi:fatty-acyl-CoA synthase
MAEERTAGDMTTSRSTPPLYGQMQEVPLLISSLIEYAARYHGDTEVVSRSADGSIHRLSYRRLHDRAKQLAAALSHLGVQPGDRVGTLAWNGYRHVELYYGVSGMGAVLHTVNPRLFFDQLEYIINHGEDRVLCFDLSFLPLVEKLRPQLPTVAHFIALGTADEVAAAQKSFPGLLSYEALLAAQSPTFVWPRLDESCASSLCYTSGTTGNPKGVLYSHRSTLLHSFAICGADSLALSSRDSALVIVPLFHANAWGIPYAAAM